jgi:hypothetical protein
MPQGAELAPNDGAERIEKQFSTFASNSGESSRREAVPTAGYDPVTAAPTETS